MMEIISHRGYWREIQEKNTKTAFIRSFEKGYGTETDLRDFNGEIVISHDIPNDNAILLSDFFKIYKSSGKSEKLALNIKSDGLQKKLLSELINYQIANYFVFDMSIPDTIGYINDNINFFSRQSEHELNPVFYDKCKGVWLDAFEGIWYESKLILEHLKNNKQVALVSPELHKRDTSDLWKMLKSNNIHLEKDLILCTDHPEEAFNYFK
jgi:glycerophosphoryl diester phosphodiesterase